MRKGIATTVMVVIIVVIIAVAGIAAYLALVKPSPTTTTSSVTSTSTSPTSTAAIPPVNNTWAVYAADYNSRDVGGIANLYASDGVYNVTGDAGGTAGTYTGPGDVTIAFATTVGHTTSFHATYHDEKVSQTSPTAATITFNMNITGVSVVVGHFNATIDVTQNWAYQSGQWLIQQDNWNYLSFVSPNPTEATVFPQWGFILHGESPNLADEHIIEWNVAPYLALIAYVSLACIGVAFLVVRRRR